MAQPDRPQIDSKIGYILSKSHRNAFDLIASQLIILILEIEGINTEKCDATGNFRDLICIIILAICSCQNLDGRQTFSLGFLFGATSASLKYIRGGRNKNFLLLKSIFRKRCGWEMPARNGFILFRSLSLSQLFNRHSKKNALNARYSNVMTQPYNVKRVKKKNFFAFLM